MDPPASTEALAFPKGRTKGNDAIVSKTEYKTRPPSPQKKIPTTNGTAQTARPSLAPPTPVGRTRLARAPIRKTLSPLKSFASRRRGGGLIVAARPFHPKKQKNRTQQFSRT